MPSKEIIERIIPMLLGSAYARIEPPILTGDSGVRHPFSILVSINGKYHAVDRYKHVGEVEVLRSYIKMYDTRASGYIISSTGVSPAARALAVQYRMAISTEREMEEGTVDEEPVTSEACGVDARENGRETRDGR